jgi:hypothetical protein
MVNQDTYRQSKVRSMLDIYRLLLAPYIIEQVKHDLDARIPNEFVVALNKCAVIRNATQEKPELKPYVPLRKPAPQSSCTSSIALLPTQRCWDQISAKECTFQQVFGKVHEELRFARKPIVES